MSEQINIRIDTNIKSEVECILAKLGLTKTQAIKLFFNKIIQEKGIPFSINIPNEDTINAMNESEKSKKLKKYNKSEELFKDLGI